MGDETNQPQSRDFSLMSLGLFETIVLFAFYAAGAIWSSVSIFRTLSEVKPELILTEVQVLWLLSCASVGGCSVFYARKLYKAGINNSYNFSPDGWTVERVSTAAFYLFRIPISVLIALVLYATWRLSIELTSENPFVAAPSSRYLFLVMGFFSGFSAGRFLEYFEKDGVKLSNFRGNDHESG